MESYKSIEVVSQDQSVAAFKFPGSSITHGPYHPPPPPSQSYGVYTPTSTFYRRSPVNPNGTSWTALRESGAIAMSTYSREKVTVRESLGYVEDALANFFMPNSYSSGGTCYGFREIMLSTIWREQGNLKHWESKGISLTDHTVTPDVGSMVTATQLSAIAKMKSGYDLLTELAESRQTLDFLRGSSSKALDIFDRIFESDSEKFRDAYRRRLTPKKLLKSSDRRLRRLGSIWMAYRYALMPLIYSYKDIEKLKRNNGARYARFSSSDTATFPGGSPESNLDSNTRRLDRFKSGDIRVTSTIKARFNASGIRSLTAQQINFNAFKTAYELIPLSFVLDWWINLGDYITAKTSPNLSIECKGCTAIRESSTTQTYLSFRTVRVQNYTYPKVNYCKPAVTYGHFSHAASGVSLLEEIERESYSRSVFNPDVVQFPSVSAGITSWKRAVDAFVLSHQKLSNLLRRFR